MAFLLIPYYIGWHYGQALRDFVGVWKNFFYFISDFFAIENLLLSLFSPWRRLEEEYADAWDLEDRAGAMLVNMVMRLVGAFIRLLFIALGLAAMILCFAIGVIFLFLWVLLPFLALYLFVQGLFFLLF